MACVEGVSNPPQHLVVEMRVDCDQDVLLLKVEQAGAGACHTGRRSCFYRAVISGAPLGAPRNDTGELWTRLPFGG